MSSLLKKILPSSIVIVLTFLRTKEGKERINLLKTIYFNFKLYPFKIAKVFPILIFRKVRIYNMGKITLKGDIQTGMLRLGHISLKSSRNILKINNKGEIVLCGPVHIEGGSLIDIRGVVLFEGYTLLAEDNDLIIRSRLTVGKYTRIGFGTFMMDSDEHFMLNINSCEINIPQKPIEIGQCCWIGNNSVVKKGVVLPDNTIVASGSMLLKDYRGIIDKYSIIGGSPARLLAHGYRRVYNWKNESVLRRRFEEAGFPSKIKIDVKQEDIEAFCMENALKIK